MMPAGGGGVINRNRSQLKQRTTIASSRRYASSGSVTRNPSSSSSFSSSATAPLSCPSSLSPMRSSAGGARGGSNAKKDGARESTVWKDVSKGKDFQSSQIFGSLEEKDPKYSKDPLEDLGSFSSNNPNIWFCVMFLDSISYLTSSTWCNPNPNFGRVLLSLHSG